MEKLKFELSADAMRVVAVALQEMPYRLSHPILQDIQAQIDAQKKAQPAAPKTPTPEGSEPSFEEM